MKTDKETSRDIFGVEQTSKYTQFVEKFKPKLTTDDCYTPPLVYEAVKGWALQNCNITENTRIIRPFKPLGDYTKEDYGGDCAVVDNPPFSILAEIIDYYLSRGIRFLIFAPYLTIMNYANRINRGLTLVITTSNITYENGAIVNTSFLSNMMLQGSGILASGSLRKAVLEADKEARKGMSKVIPKYVYPPNVLTQKSFDNIIKAGGEFYIPAKSLYQIRSLDHQKAHKKQIYGAGLLCSDIVAREALAREALAREALAREALAREALAREALAREALAREAVGEVLEWELSPRELSIIKDLG